MVSITYRLYRFRRIDEKGKYRLLKMNEKIDFTKKIISDINKVCITPVDPRNITENHFDDRSRFTFGTVRLRDQSRLSLAIVNLTLILSIRKHRPYICNIDCHAGKWIRYATIEDLLSSDLADLFFGKDIPITKEYNEFFQWLFPYSRSWSNASSTCQNLLKEYLQIFNTYKDFVSRDEILNMAEYGKYTYESGFWDKLIEILGR